MLLDSDGVCWCLATRLRPRIFLSVDCALHCVVHLNRKLESTVRRRSVLLTHWDYKVFQRQVAEKNPERVARCCAALGKSCITLHDVDLVHPLKEVDAQAMAWPTTPAQVVEILEYVVSRS